MTINIETGAVTLGYVGYVAAWQRTAPTLGVKGRQQSMLIISSCAYTDDGVHTPAASITINGVAGLHALRAAIDEALKYEKEIESGVQGAAPEDKP